MKSFVAFALEGFPLVQAGDDIAMLIVETAGKEGFEIEDGDVIVIAQKVFSKAESRVVRLEEVVASKRAFELAEKTAKDPRFIELVLRETRRILKVSRDILLVEDRRGLVCINAGIDKSNIEGKDCYALLPENPDVSAEKCRVRIGELTGKSVGVVMCDTYSRPFRRGQVNFAIGVAGVGLFRDYRGREDLFGQVLRVKNVAVVDEFAAAAELLMGQAAEARPVIVLRGLRDVVIRYSRQGVDELRISNEEDLFKDVL
ncbi:coenzyme F420-0:L-glutamate ligase [Candidatus Bathyarchaeota archaeon]|nr:coenzyme F420-0:L-glutamate ligase [Candidatus Bathyarchaeota archaeon]